MRKVSRNVYYMLCNLTVGGDGLTFGEEKDCRGGENDRWGEFDNNLIFQSFSVLKYD